jgi:dihydropteroate synthase
VSDLIQRHHPRVIAGSPGQALASLGEGASDAHARTIRDVQERFTVLVENAAELIWQSAGVLTELGIVPVPLSQLEHDVERMALTGIVAARLAPGRAPLVDMLRRTIDNYRRTTFDWLPRDRDDAPTQTLIMGILNTTPDSFSDGGRFDSPEAAIRQASRMIEQGADIIDVGGCSTRPGAKAPSPEEEVERVVPVIEAIRRFSDIPVSIDTFRALVARAALEAGADIVNDVTALTGDEDMATLAAAHNAPVVLMHMQRTPETMQQAPAYDDLTAEIYRFLSRAVSRAEAAGIPRERIAIDPGFGFGKTVEHNLELLRRLHEFRSLGCPMLIGTSRKSTIGAVLDRPVAERLHGTAATMALAVAQGVGIVRVHDVAQMRDVVRMSEAVLKGSQKSAQTEPT